MSKKFPKIKPIQAEIEMVNTVSIPTFEGEESYYVILDLQWQRGLYFFNQADSWLRNSSETQVLYYYTCVSDHTFAAIGENSALLEEIRAKWPPSLWGLHLISCAHGRIQLLLFYGEPIELCTQLLNHGHCDVDQSSRDWAVNRFLLHDAIAGVLAAYLQQLAAKDALFLLGSVEYEASILPKLTNSPWPWPKYRPSDPKRNIMIVGAGLAGCYLARVCADLGFTVFLLEQESSIAQVASGNRFAVLYPKISMYQAPLTELNIQAYPYAYHIWNNFLKRQPELGKVLPLWQSIAVELDELSNYLGTNTAWFSKDAHGLMFHRSLLLNMPAMCEFLVAHPRIQVCYQKTATPHFNSTTEQWHYEDMMAAYCVLATGYQSITGVGGIKGMRGQITQVKPVYDQEIIYCKQGHMTPVWYGQHAIGASYRADIHDLSVSEQDDLKNLAPWRSFFSNQMPWEIVGHWVGIRGVSLDHVPLVGAVPNIDEFMQQYRVWRHHAHQVVDSCMPNLQGLFAFMGFGSRGLLTIPLMAQVLMSMLLGRPPVISNKMMQALAPARFLKKSMSKT